jgi:plasmid replication initiation protein
MVKTGDSRISTANPAQPRTACKAPTRRKPAVRRGGVAEPLSESLQLALPVIDSPLAGDVRNGRQMMMHCYFAHQLIKRNPITELPTYDDGKIRIEVRGTKIGVATIDDAEILLYVLSLAAAKFDRGEPVTSQFTFTLKDYADVAGLVQSGSVSKTLGEALDRLKETTVKTNMESGGKVYVEGFSWIEKFWYDRGKDGTVNGKKRKGRINSITVRFCDFLWRAVVIDRNLLSYNRSFFDLSPLKRRLYELARVHCNDRPAFRISLTSLRDRVGTANELRYFKSDLEAILAEDPKSPLLGYTFTIDNGVPPGRKPSLAKVVVEFRDASYRAEDIGYAPLIDATYLEDLRTAS